MIVSDILLLLNLDSKKRLACEAIGVGCVRLEGHVYLYCVAYQP